MEQSSKEIIRSMWDTLEGFGATGSEEALMLLMGTLASLVGAQNAYWMGTLRLSDTPSHDPVQGWRPREVVYLNPSAKRLAVKKEHMKRIRDGRIDPTVIANLKDVGKFRITFAHEIRPSGWLESEFYKSLFKPLGIVDTLYVTTPLGEDIESWLAFERTGKDAPNFSEHDRQLIDYATRPLKWFHRQLVLKHGVMLVDKPLKEAERRIVNSLLTGMTEQEIAKHCELTTATVHTYCTRIYRKFNVRGRAGLIALWLGKNSSV